MQDLKRQRARIIIVDVDDDLARSIMCEAYHLNMTANHGYVWFLPSWFSDNWYNTSFYNVRKNETVVRCPTQEMVKVCINRSTCPSKNFLNRLLFVSSPLMGTLHYPMHFLLQIPAT